MVRTAFVNVGMMGHVAIGAMLESMMTPDLGVEATHLSLARGLTLGDRVVRRLVTMRPVPRGMRARTNLDLGRWRAELAMGIVAEHRIREVEAKRGRFDVVHFHTQAAAYASFARMRTTPTVVSIDITQSLASNEARNAIERKTYWPNVLHDHAVFRAAAAIVSPSRWAADDLAQRHPECAHKLHILPWAVRFDSFDPAWCDERLARGSSPARFLFMGHDFVRKGGLELLDAWRAAAFRPDEATLEVLTMHPLADVPPGVKVLVDVKGRSPEWVDAWRRADVFVMPTRNDAYPVVFSEAAAAGLPAIGTRVGAIAEIVEHEKTGFVAARLDVPAIVAAMRALVADPGRRRAMGVAARKRIERVASPEGYAARLADLLHDVSGRPRAASPTRGATVEATSR
jgi:glycosyltransferase involved in cell wall biosynthesis